MPNRNSARGGARPKTNQLSQPGRPTKGQRADQMARKREERAAKTAYRKEKKAQQYTADDDTFANFQVQLQKMGLQLRETPGDGNCLFRALGDQLQGHGRDHLKHRHDVVKYIQEHRADFEPFVEDDVPFERHVGNLNKVGTYAGNDVIVAFARLQKVTVFIHQLSTPCWQVHGQPDKKAAKQLHISYHNGDHYSSVRRIGDNSETPANIHISDLETEAKDASLPGKKNKSHNGANNHHQGGSTQNAQQSWCEMYEDADEGSNQDPAQLVRADAISGSDDVTDMEEMIMKMTGCQDKEMVRQTLEDHFYDADATVNFMCQIMAATTGQCDGLENGSSGTVTDIDGGIWSENGSGSRLFGPPTIESSTSSSSSSGLCNSNFLHSGAKPKQKIQVSSTQGKRNRKLEKKMRAQERHRQKALGINTADVLSDDEDDDDITVIKDTLGVLKI